MTAVGSGDGHNVDAAWGQGSEKIGGSIHLCEIVKPWNHFGLKQTGVRKGVNIIAVFDRD